MFQVHNDVLSYNVNMIERLFHVQQQLNPYYDQELLLLTFENVCELVHIDQSNDRAKSKDLFNVKLIDLFTTPGNCLRFSISSARRWARLVSFRSDYFFC